jgi:hypothetical protein
MLGSALNPTEFLFTPNIPAAMPANRNSPPKPGSNRAYLLYRLERDGHRELLAAVHGRRLSAYAAAEAAGIIKRPPPPGGVSVGSGNQRRRRDWAIYQALKAPAK